MAIMMTDYDFDKYDNIKLNDIKLFIHIVEMNETMKLANISHKYYNGDYIFEIMYLNGITNYFGVGVGDILIMPDPDQIGSVFDFGAAVISDIRDAIMDINRRRKKDNRDNNRGVDNQNKSSRERDKRMPPHIVNNDKIVVQDGKMIIKPNF